MCWRARCKICARARCKVRTLQRDLDLIANLMYTVVVGNYATIAISRNGKGGESAPVYCNGAGAPGLNP